MYIIRDGQVTNQRAKESLAENGLSVTNTEVSLQTRS